MKKILIASLALVFAISACQTGLKDKTVTDTVANVIPPPPPKQDTIGKPPLPVEDGDEQTSTTPIPPPPPPKQDTQDNTIYNFVKMDHPPSYPGGMAQFYKFLGTQIRYPSDAAENNIEGKVFISFVVEKDGTVSNVEVERKLGYGTDEEALRVLKMSKKWNPGMDNGKPVRTKYNIPITFNLAN